VVWIVLGALALVFVIGGIAFPKKSTPNVNAGTRAVIVPTADAARTVLVAPCGTGTNVAAEGAAALRDTTGTLAFTLPQGPGTRVVLVPRCSSPISNLPSAAFALKPGTPIPSTAKGPSTAIAAPGSAQSQLLVPVGSPVRTVVLAPCDSHSPKPAQRVLAGAGATAIAPAC
jgi:hypothetical protein